jgi:cyclic pyranopterin phosphate synthase
MKDTFDRKINYMRMSITDRCNLRCCYCMPNGVSDKVAMKDILRYEEMVEIAEAAVRCGITRFKVTGGEPLARLGCADFVGMLKRIPGVEQVTMTTNGVLLSENLPKLSAAGLDAVNVSLDTLKPARFQDITGFDELGRVMKGIQEALALGITVKINTVLQKDVNASEWADLVELARSQPIDVRFIEMMPIGYGKDFEVVYNEDLRAELMAKFPGTVEDARVHGNGPAAYLQIPGFRGSIGFISAMHGKFCAQCNRIRLTSTGKLKPCLCYGDTIDIKSIFSLADAEERQVQLQQAIQKAIRLKPEAHCFEERAQVTELQEMVEIGG